MKRNLILLLLICHFLPLGAVSRLYRAGDFYFQALGFNKEGHFAWQTITESKAKLYRQDLVSDEIIFPFNLQSISNSNLAITSWGKKGYKNLKVHSVDIQRKDREDEDLITAFRVIAVKSNKEKELAVWQNLKIKEIKQMGYIKSPFENRLAIIIQLVSDEGTEFRVVGCYGDIVN